MTAWRSRTVEGQAEVTCLRSARQRSEVTCLCSQEAEDHDRYSAANTPVHGMTASALRVMLCSSVNSLWKHPEQAQKPLS